MRRSNQMETVTIFRNVNSRAFLKRVTYSKKIQSKHYVIPMVRIVERDVYIYNTPSNTCSGTFV